MALRLGALQDALLDAGATPEMAKRAAEELAHHETQVAGMRSDISLLKRMVGTNTALTLAILWRVFS